DRLWVSGTIGDSALGLAIRQGRAIGDNALVLRYVRPMPRLALGQSLAPLVTAMADVSDGLLIDARRMAVSSGCAIHLDLDATPLSDAFVAARGDDTESRLFAATGGDDYELLFTAQEAATDAIMACARMSGVPVMALGECAAGGGLHLRSADGPIALPERLGWLHD
ncbi:MAG TPA: AIR synthase-related protein, partial [Sphingobium sp.]